MVETLSLTLKCLLQKYSQKNAVEREKCLPYVLWAYRGSTLKTTVYLPYELLFGRRMRSPLDKLVKHWKGKLEEVDIDVIEYLCLLNEKMEIVRELDGAKVTEAKHNHLKHHDLRAVV